MASGVLDAVHSAAAMIGRQDIATLTLTLGLLCFALLAIVVLLRTRKAAERVKSAAHDEVMRLYADNDRLKALLLSEPQVLVEWSAATDEPEILGDTGLVMPGGVPERVLAFGSWLEPAT